MRQSITTKYIGPTDRTGSRIKATSSSGLSKTIHYDDALDTDDNHKAAAIALCKKMDWKGRLATGGAPKGTGNVYVFIDADTFEVK